jgi:myo-inositol 2-dehydrogenase/D-chiro-inositol 1-dehydrogenase
VHDIAIFGAGRIGRIHAANAAREGRVRLKYVVDPIAAAADSLAGSVGAQVVSLEGALSDESVRGVIVASSTDSHLDHCVAAARAGKAIFCEKPIDLDFNRAASVAGDLGGAPLFLGFNRRFDPSFQRLKARMDAGDIGAVETIHIISHDPSPPPADYVKVSGGLFKDMAIHDFDLARWLLGEPVVEVFAAGANLIDPAIGAVGDIDTAKTLLRTASGKICFISNSRRSGYGYDQRIELFGSQGSVRADNVASTTVETWTEGARTGEPFQNFFLDRYADAYRAEMTHFADMLDGTVPAAIGYADGLAALGLAEAAGESMQSGEPVRVDVEARLPSNAGSGGPGRQ